MKPGVVCSYYFLKNTLLFFCFNFLFYHCLLFSQLSPYLPYLPYLPYSPYSHYSPYTFFSFNLNSTSLTNRFYYTVYQGGGIDENLKNSVSSRLIKKNFAGGDINYGAGITGLINRPGRINNLYWQFGIADREHFDAKFTDDLLNFVLFGNKRFAGQIARLGPLNINYFRFQQAKTGLIFGHTAGSMFSITLSYLKGEQHYSLNSSDLDFYTSPIGDQVSLTGDIALRSTDTSNTGFGAFNGNGFSSDIFMKWSSSMFLRGKKRPTLLNFSFTDAGIIYWNQSSLTYYKNMAYFYEGVVLDSIGEFNLLGSQFGKLNDSISASVQYGMKNGRYNTPLPSTVRFSVAQEHHDRWIIEAGGLYRINANFTPFGYLKESFRIKENMIASLSAGYGGYGRLSVGTEWRMSIKKFDVSAGITNIEGIIFPMKSGGLGGYAMIRGFF